MKDDECHRCGGVARCDGLFLNWGRGNETAVMQCQDCKTMWTYRGVDKRWIIPIEGSVLDMWVPEGVLIIGGEVER